MLTQEAELFEQEACGEDERLVARVCAGEPALFAQLYRRYYKRVFALAFGMTGRREQADDMAQEVFLRAYERLGTFGGNSSFATWLYRLAVNHCLNYCRSEHRHRNRMVGAEDATSSANAPGPGAEENIASALWQDQVQIRVRRALQALKPDARLLIVLKDVEGLSYEEIADRLNCSTGTVASGLSRARKLLARKLEDLRGKI